MLTANGDSIGCRIAVANERVYTYGNADDTYCHYRQDYLTMNTSRRNNNNMIP